MVYCFTSCYFLFSTTLHMRITLNTVSAQGVKSLGNDNNAGIVMPFRVFILLKKWSKHFLLIIFIEKIMIAIHGRAWHDNTTFIFATANTSSLRKLSLSCSQLCFGAPITFQAVTVAMKSSSKPGLPNGVQVDPQGSTARFQGVHIKML